MSMSLLLLMVIETEILMVKKIRDSKKSLSCTRAGAGVCAIKAPLLGGGTRHYGSHWEGVRIIKDSLGGPWLLRDMQ